MGFFKDVICLTFLKDFIRKKRFSNFKINLPGYTIKTNSWIAPYAMTFVSFCPKPWDLDSRLMGCRTVSSAIYFFKEDKGEKIKDWFDFQPDSTIQPKARGILYMECDFHRIPYKKITRGLGTSQPWCSQGSTRKTPSECSSGELEDVFRSTDACSTRLRRARKLIRPGAMGLLNAHGYRML